jgi:hypothetical protein
MYAIIAGIFLLLSYALLGYGIYAYTLITSKWYIYLLVLWGLYCLLASFFLVKEIIIRFKKYHNAKGIYSSGIVTHRYSSSPDVSLRPLVEVKNGESYKTYALIGLYLDSSFRKDFPDGTIVKVFIPSKNDGEALLLANSKKEETNHD